MANIYSFNCGHRQCRYASLSYHKAGRSEMVKDFRFTGNHMSTVSHMTSQHQSCDHTLSVTVSSPMLSVELRSQCNIDGVTLRLDWFT